MSTPVSTPEPLQFCLFTVKDKARGEQRMKSEQMRKLAEIRLWQCLGIGLLSQMIVPQGTASDWIFHLSTNHIF